MPAKTTEAADFIVPLNINGLEGRMLILPSPNTNKSKRNILFVYGSHSSIERWWGVAQELNKYGALVMPDLPGLGGMTPLYKIGRQPNLDNMADYLAAFIKLKYKNKKITLIGMSLGFAIATRMLQKYPELVKKVDLLVSVVGLAHKDEFAWTMRRHMVYLMTSRFFSHKWPSVFFKHTALQPAVIRRGYHKTHNAKNKFAEISGDEFERSMETEIELWKINDIRTQFKHYVELLTLDNTKVPVKLPVHHVAVKNDSYFDNIRVEQHMRQIFSDFKIYHSKNSSHAPTVIATAKEAAPLIPEGLRKELKKKPKVK